MEAFIRDLQLLRHGGKGPTGCKALGGRMKISHGSVHDALKQNGRIPSEYVLRAMLNIGAPVKRRLG